MQKYPEPFTKSISALFKKNDKDNSGSLELKELMPLLSSKSLYDSLKCSKPSEADIGSQISQFDKDGNGKLSLEEFKALMWGVLSKSKTSKDSLDPSSSLYPEEFSVDMADMFYGRDKDHSGFLEKNEIKAIITGKSFCEIMHMKPMNDKEIDKLIAKYDCDKNAKVSISEFYAMMWDISSRAEKIERGKA